MFRGNLLRVYGRKILIVLAVASLVVAAIIGSLGFETDYEPILSDLVPGATFKVLEDRAADGVYLYGVYTNGTTETGFVTIGSGPGYIGPITVMTIWTVDGTITQVFVAEHNETLSYYQKLDASDYLTEFVDRNYTEPLTLGEDIDAASGATRSSEGVEMGVHEGRQILSEYLGDPYPVPPKQVEWGSGETALLIMLGSVVVFRTVPFFRRRHWLRFITLVFGFFIFGIWLAASLSLVNFVVWPIGFSPSFYQHIFVYILVFGIVGLALIFGKNFWCFWMCPFAAIQEGAHFIGGMVRPITRRQLLLRNTRFFLLWGVVFLALLLRKPAVATFEPWNNLFSLEGTALEWIFVISLIITAIFIYDFWCHYLCPVGAIMDIVLRIRMWLAAVGRRVFAR